MSIEANTNTYPVTIPASLRVIEMPFVGPGVPWIL
jgi:hypothetical protein